MSGATAMEIEFTPACGKFHIDELLEEIETNEQTTKINIVLKEC